MDAPGVVAILNELLGREQRAIAPRLFESTVFVSRLSLAGNAWTQRVVRASLEHRGALARLIQELGGELDPRRGDLWTADLHFQELRRVLPRIERDYVGLIGAYEVAAARIGSVARASSLVGTIRESHTAELAELRDLLRSDSTVFAA